MVTHVEETLTHVTIDDKPVLTVDGLVRQMADSVQRVANIDELLEAASKPLEMIAQGYAETLVCVEPSLAKLYLYLFHLQF
jgi:hypothetical protein